MKRRRLANRFASRTDRDLQLSLSEWRCAICQKDLKDGEYQIDHQVPFSEKGPTKWWNLQPLCLECHSQKSREAVSGASSRKANRD